MLGAKRLGGGEGRGAEASPAQGASPRWGRPRPLIGGVGCGTLVLAVEPNPDSSSEQDKQKKHDFHGLILSTPEEDFQLNVATLCMSIRK
jgi:hypothetical protein